LPFFDKTFDCCTFKYRSVIVERIIDMKIVKRLIALLLLASVLMTSMPLDGFSQMSVYAAETTKLTVTGDIVNVRKGAGTSYAKVTTVTRSTVLTSQGTAKDASGKTWYKVTVNGTTGYIISTYVSASTTSSNSQTLTVTGTTVYVRKGAGTNYDYITTVKKGATYAVVGSAKDSSGKTWYKISINNTTGYIISTYVKVSDSAPTSTTAKPTNPTSAAPAKQKLTVTGDVVNVRKGAGTSNAKVTSVKRNATFDVLGSAKDSSGTVWYKISVSGTTGYIISTYVKVTTVTTTSTTTTTTASTTTTTKVTADDGTVIITVPDNSTASTSSSTDGTTASTATTASASSTTSTTTTTTAKPTTGTTGSTMAANIAVSITSGSLELRSGAGTAYSLITTLKAGDEIVILSNRSDSSGNLWYRVQAGIVSGYVKASDLTAATAAPQTTTTASSTTGTSAVIDVPGRPIVTGNDISESIPTTPNDTATRYVTYGTVTCDSPSSKLNVRSGAGTNYGILGTLSHNSQVIITGTSGDWYKIEYGSGFGYVLSSFVSNVKTGTITVSISFPRSYYYVEQGATLNLALTVPGYTVSYSSENSTAAPISSSGVVTGKTPGLYTITAKAGSASATTEVVVLKPKTANVVPMTISAEGTQFIANWEGGGTPMGEVIVFFPYQDVSGYWTVGYGHAVTSAESKKWTKEQAVEHFNTEITVLLGEGHEITEEKPYLTAEEASSLLNADLNKGPYVKAVSDWAVRNGVVLNQPQFDALVSFCYNLGPNYWNSDTNYFYLKSAIIAFRNGSDAVPEQIIEGFTRYIKSGGVNLKGLWWRRRNEAEMFIKGDYAIDRENKFTLPNITWG